MFATGDKPEISPKWRPILRKGINVNKRYNVVIVGQKQTNTNKPSTHSVSSSEQNLPKTGSTQLSASTANYSANKRHSIFQVAFAQKRAEGVKYGENIPHI